MQATHLDEPIDGEDEIDLTEQNHHDYEPFNPDDYTGLEDLMNPQEVSSEALLPLHVKAACIAYHCKQQQ